MSAHDEEGFRLDVAFGVDKNDVGAVSFTEPLDPLQ